MIEKQLTVRFKKWIIVITNETAMNIEHDFGVKLIE